MLNIEEIKDYIISLNIVDNNEYFDQYIKIIQDNVKTKQEKYKTQKHHIIPLFVYRKLYSLDRREDAEDKKYIN